MGERIQKIREELRGKSLAVAQLVKFGQYETVNEAIIGEYYRSAEHKTFNTFRGWRKSGFRVKKGEKCFHIWSRPVAALKAETNPEAAAPEDSHTYFSVAFLFSNAQVEPIRKNEQATEKHATS